MLKAKKIEVSYKRSTMTTPQRVETVRRLQTAMANETTYLFVRCFGAQAMTCGVVLGMSQMTALSFKVFGLAMIPYIAGFNFWFSGIGPATGVINNWMWLDFIGNTFFMLGSFWCAKVLEEEERQNRKGRR
ncbi:hypothetical protein N658DRAFT_562441 [Parathielavia hyrcaniae]|uniref:Uncharacterized protein n=1 Tax=Parathielavia hyrcaniae TaxID=113614 RepID=A0AAN6PR57_9PEZI|nr:hypothetical protein N658DRAFT_562441 [Parathielavia hyrcaniae]